MGLRGIINYLAPVTSPHPPQPLTPNYRWLGQGSDLQIGLFHLLAPLVYVYDSRRGESPEPAAIDLALPISSVTVPPAGRELPYWPAYGCLAPHQRRTYLQWLAGNRSSVAPELGYAFLFFYNLERRALIDKADVRLIFKEVTRLRQMYASAPQQASGSWDNYTSRFLWILLVANKEVLSIDELRVHAKSMTHWTEENLAVALASLIIRDCRLTGSLAFSITESLPQSLRSVVQRRVPGEFEALFKKRFREQFPDGIQVEISSNKRAFLYRGANNALPPLEVSFLDPLGKTNQFKPLSKIWNACIDDLKKLGTLSRAGADLDAVRRWEAMPDDLRAGTDHPLTDEFCRLVESKADQGGQTVIPVEELASVLDHGTSTKLTVARSRHLCETAEQIGYFLEPDARLTGRAYRPGEQVIAFLKLSTAAIDPARYGPAACMLQFGFLVASSDGEADQHELTVISQHIESAFQLQEDEVRRMERLRVLLQRTGPDRPLLKKLVRGLGSRQRQAIAKLLVAIVLADGVVTREERKSLQSACILLSVDYSKLESELGTAALSDHPVTVLPARKGAPGEPVPPEPEKAFALNRNAIAAILAETRDVAQMLAQAMSTADSPEAERPTEIAQALPVLPVEQEVKAATPPPAATSPPSRYTALYQALLGQDRWTLADAEALARSSSLMLSGAIDALNEWSTDFYGGQLFVEEEGFLVVERSLLA